MFEMPKRTDADGAVGVHRRTDATISISAIHDGEPKSLMVTRYNAARILVMLCVMLEVPPPKQLGKMPM